MATVAKSSRLLRTTLGTDSAGPFSLGFRLFDTDGLEVYVDGAIQTVTTDYTISATFSDGYDDSATITFTSTLSSGSELLVYGKMVADREADYADGGPLLTSNLNQELARLAAMVSELQRDVSRAFLFQSEFSQAVEVENSTFLGFGATGLPMLYLGTSDVAISTAMTPVVQAATLAAGRTALGLAIGSDVQAYDAGLADSDAVDIDGGTIDDTAIGGTTPAAGAFTTLGASGLATLSGGMTASGTLTGLVGRLINIQVFDTAGAATYTPTPGTKTAFVRATSGGGAGGGADSAVTSSSGDGGAGGGGAGGTPFEGGLDVSGGGYSATLAIGAGGTAASAAAGGDGGATTWDDGTNTLTLPGGLGGGSIVNNAAIVSPVGGLGQSATFSANWTCTLGSTPTGADGSNALIIPRGAGVSSAASQGGTSGSSIFGGGKRGSGTNAQNNSNAGRSGTVPGEGGSGASSLGVATAVAGGAGADGMIVVFEYSA